MLFSKTGFHYNVLYPKQALSKYHCCNFSSTLKNKRILSIIKSGRKTLCLQKWVNPSAHQPVGTYDIHSFKRGKWPNCSKLREIDFWVHTFFYRLLKRFALATFTHMNTHHHSHTHTYRQNSRQYLVQGHVHMQPDPGIKLLTVRATAHYNPQWHLTWINITLRSLVSPHWHLDGTLYCWFIYGGCGLL